MTLPHIGIEAEIEHMWFGSVLVLENGDPLGQDNFCYRVIGIFQVRNSAGIE
jgi:hypothetical protein